MLIVVFSALTCVMEFITWVLCCEQNVDLFGVTKKHAF